MQQKPRLVAPVYLTNTSGQASYSKTVGANLLFTVCSGEYIMRSLLANQAAAHG